jgi:hypothetical protein
MLARRSSRRRSPGFAGLSDARLICNAADDPFAELSHAVAGQQIRPERRSRSR